VSSHRNFLIEQISRSRSIDRCSIERNFYLQILMPESIVDLFYVK